MNEITFSPIGVIHSPFMSPADAPIQPCRSNGALGAVELKGEFTPALKDLDRFSHVILLFHFHLSRGYDLEVIPFLDTVPRGLFATRAPRRPNGIGISIVRLIGIDGHKLDIADVDVVDGTPLLDIKPYVPVFDEQTEVRIGWLSDALRKDGGER